MSALKTATTAAKLLLPEAFVERLYGDRLPEIDGRTIDAKAHVLSELAFAVRGDGSVNDVLKGREDTVNFAKLFDTPCPRSVKKKDILLPGAVDDRPVRVYKPKDWQRGTLLYLHGGGWVQGNADSHDGLCGELAEMSGLRVLSFEYRLAPEHPFPAAPDDVLACYRMLILGEHPLHIPPEELIIGGDSAGANLTAALMHDLAERHLPMPKGQLLIYPAVDARLISQSMQSLATQPLLPLTRINWFLDQYLLPDQNRLVPRVSPLFSDYFDRNPPALIIAAGHDPLWDDAQSYADRLSDVALVNFPGQVHAVMSLGKVIPQCRTARQAAADWMAQVMAG